VGSEDERKLKASLWLVKNCNNIECACKVVKRNKGRSYKRGHNGKYRYNASRWKGKRAITKAGGEMTSESNKIKIIRGRLFSKLMSTESFCISSFLIPAVAYYLAGSICFIAGEIRAGTSCFCTVILTCNKLISIRRHGKNVSEIWGSHGGEYEDGCLLGCWAVWWTSPWWWQQAPLKCR
jgi:hypothetical protein